MRTLLQPFSNGTTVRTTLNLFPFYGTVNGNIFSTVHVHIYMYMTHVHVHCTCTYMYMYILYTHSTMYMYIQPKIHNIQCPIEATTDNFIPLYIHIQWYKVVSIPLYIHIQWYKVVSWCLRCLPHESNDESVVHLRDSRSAAQRPHPFYSCKVDGGQLIDPHSTSDHSQAAITTISRTCYHLYM